MVGLPLGLTLLSTPCLKTLARFISPSCLCHQAANLVATREQLCFVDGRLTADCGRGLTYPPHKLHLTVTDASVNGAEHQPS